MHINIRGEKTLTVRILIRDGTSNFVHENIIRWIHAYALTVNSFITRIYSNRISFPNSDLLSQIKISKASFYV